MAEPQSPPPHPHRWLQYRLRTLLAAMLLVAIGARFLSHRDYLRRQQEAIYNLNGRVGMPVTADAAELTVPWGFDEDELRYLAYLPRLRRLSITGTDFTNGGTSHLARLTSLRELEIYAVRLSDDALLDLTQLSRLERFHLSAQISRDGVPIVARMTQLRELALYLPPDADTKPLRTMAQLESLRFMAGNTMRGGDLEFLAEMPRLKTFWLQCSVEGDVLSSLRHVPQLTELRLQANQLRNEDLEHIRGHTRLRHLTLESNSGNYINNDGLQCLEQMTDLRFLNVSNCRQITDGGLASVVRLRNLKTLWLRRTGVTDRGLARLAGLQKLERLNLHGTSVTPEGLQLLADFPALRHVELPARWPKETISGLRQQLPGIEIQH
jgi:hypothetical protein